MELFKKQHFESTYALKFPEVRPLSPPELAAPLWQCSNYGPAWGTARLRWISCRRSIGCSDRCREWMRTAILFDLLRVLPDHVRERDTVLINWYRFDDVDEVRTKDLATFFSDFWYASSDDIDIFDPDVTCILSVRHDGTVKIAAFGTA
jgi:hypothetical protein